jgi:hypothetical protein
VLIAIVRWARRGRQRRRRRQSACGNRADLGPQIHQAGRRRSATAGSAQGGAVKAVQGSYQCVGRSRLLSAARRGSVVQLSCGNNQFAGRDESPIAADLFSAASVTPAGRTDPPRLRWPGRGRLSAARIGGRLIPGRSARWLSGPLRSHTAPGKGRRAACRPGADLAGLNRLTGCLGSPALVSRRAAGRARHCGKHRARSDGGPCFAPSVRECARQRPQGGRSCGQ